MNEQPIPFFDGLASGLDELSGSEPLFVNFLIDSSGAGHMRPGIRAWSDFGASPTTSPVIGIYPWRAYLIFVTADRNIWAWISPGNIAALSSIDPATKLDGSLRPIFTYDSQRVAITGGGAPQQWLGVGLSSRLAPGQTMPDGSSLSFTHIAYNAQRFVANNYNLSGLFQWTDPGVGNHTTWPIVGAYFAEAEAAPDPAVALWANANEVFVFGTQTTQVFIPDPVTAFAAGSTVEVGCGAPYSIIKTAMPGEGIDAFAWLDDRHRFVVSDGRSYQAISTPLIANDIMAEGFVVSDCWGARIHFGMWDMLVWIFPSEGRGFVYDQTTQKWQGEFRSLNTSTGEWEGWIPNCYCFVPGATPQQNLHLVGMPNGTIAELTVNASDDMGQTIEAVARSGFQNRGTFTRKLCSMARVAMRRGATLPPAVAPTVELRYRDDLGAFKPAIQWSMGQGGDYQPVQEKRNLGMYRQRQWELSWTGGQSFVMTGATETFETGDT